MASYPGSVKTFTARSAGQTIEASHVGDLQDEVNAIESGLLNGTAPINSSNSTVAALSVSAGSTLRGPVAFGSCLQVTLSSGDANNYNPSGMSTSFSVRLVGDTNGSTISGIVPNGTGRLLLLINPVTPSIGIKHIGGGSASSNQIALRSQSDTVITVGGTMLLYHDPIGNTWKQIG